MHNKWTHTHSMYVGHVATIIGKNMLSIGNIFSPLRVAPMGIGNNF